MAEQARVHFIGGEKGGVGKSVMARVLSQYFIDRHIPFVGFDTDKSHASLLRFYAEFTAPVVIDRYEEMDRVVEAAIERPERRVVVDLAAQTHRFLVEWIDETGLVALSGEMNVSLTYWHVTDAGRDSAELLERWLAEFGGRVPLVVVLNELRGDDFSMVEASGTLARAKALGSTIIRLGRLQDGTMQKIDAGNTSFWAATHRGETAGPAFGLLERQRVKNWLHRIYEAIDRVGP